MKAASLLTVLCLATTVGGAELKLSGVLGQSQPGGVPPLPDSQILSATSDASGQVLFTDSANLYQLDKAKREAVVRLPGFNGRLMMDGRQVFLLHHTIIYRIDRKENGALEKVRIADIRRGYARVGVVPDGTTQRFGEKVKFFAYDSAEKKVYGWDRNGQVLGVILDLNDFKSKGTILGIGMMPGSGYLIVSTEYPDMHLYRFNPDGRPEAGGIWPVAGRVAHFSLCNGKLWGSNNISIMIENELSGNRRTEIGDNRDMYAFAVCSDSDGGYYVASSQGLKHYSGTETQRCNYRIGGLKAGTALAVANGLVISISGFQISAVKLDDAPDSPLENTGNESWHVGKNWSSDGIAAIAKGNTFLILDRKYNKIWRFDPAVVQWPAKDRMVALEYTLNRPTDIAYAGEKLLIADNGKLNLATDLKDPVIRVDAFSTDEVVCAGKDFVALLRQGKTVWKRPLTAVDLAVINDYIAVAADELLLLDKKGNLVGRLPYRLCSLAVSGKWLLGSDQSRSAILRFKLK